MIDAHVYCLPPRMRDTDTIALPRSERLIQDAIYLHPEGPYALSLSTPEAILNSMDDSGIEKSALVSFPWADTDLCLENNDFILEQTAANKRFMAICAVQPVSEKALKEAGRVLDAGALGLKINPAWQGFHLNDANMNGIVDVILKHDVFLMLHVDHAYKHSPTSPAHLFDMASRYPDLKILAAHLGGLLGLYSLYPPLARQLQNVWYDTAVSSTLEMVRWYCQAGLEDKVVFGSDFPFNHSHSQKQLVDTLQSLGLGRETLAGIMKKNFSHLAGMKTGKAFK